MNDVQDFIIDLENSAKRILKQSNKKHLEASRQESLSKIRSEKLNKRAQDEKLVGKMVITDTFNFDRTSNELVFGKSTNGPMQSPMGRSMSKTKVLNYSVPRMTVGLGADTVNVLDDTTKPKSMEPGCSSPAPVLKSGQLSPIKKRPLSAKEQKSMALEEEKNLRKSKILEKLKTSPFQPSPAVLGLEGKGTRPTALTSKSTPNLKKETDWALRMHAAAVLGGKSSSNVSKIVQKAQSSSSMPRNVTTEPQGPIDWSSKGLREKYRNEDARELAWSTYMDAISYADNTAFEEDKQLIPIAVVERHPLMQMFFDRLTLENMTSRQRTLARLRMKRFVQNVQEVWLTNLAHLREHQVESLFGVGVPGSRSGSRSGSGSQSEGSVGMNVGLGGTGGGGVPRGKGLRDRRDVKAIQNMSSQIQSVSHTRAMKSSFYTTRMPEPSVRLDYVAQPCPKHDISNMLPPPPMLQLLLLQRSGLKTSGSGYPFVVSIDRLIPAGGSGGVRAVPVPVAPDDEGGVGPTSIAVSASPSSDVLWRISLVRTNQQLDVKSFLVRENEVHYFLTSLYNSCLSVLDTADSDSLNAEGAIRQQENSWEESTVGGSERGPDETCPSGGVHNEDRMECAVESIFVAEEVDVAWGNGIELDCGVSVGVKIVGQRSLAYLSPTSHKDNCILVVIRAELKDDFEGVVVHPLVMDPVEMLSLLGVQEAPPMAESLRDWLRESVQSSSSNNYIWERLCTQLCFCEGDEDLETGDPLPSNLDLRPHEEDLAVRYQDYDVTVGDEVVTHMCDSVLPTAKAIAAAYTLFSLLEVSDELEVSVGQLNVPDGVSICSDPDDMVEAHSSDKIILEVEPPVFEHSPDNFSFEELSDVVNSLSLRVSGGALLLKQIPGASAVGSMGLWYEYPLHKERTQASAIFYRNPQVSSTNTVLVNLTLALDTSVLSLPSLAWEPYPEQPVPSPHDPADGVVAMCSPFPSTLTSTPLISLFDKQTTPVVHILSTTPIEGQDFPELEPIRNKRRKSPAGFVRHISVRNDNGFRNIIIENLLATDPVLPTIVFGVTRLGAMPNATAVHTRSVWHSIICITECINRLRGAQDYHYVLRNELSRGPNDPACFTLRFFGYGNKDLFRADVICSAFQQMEMQYKEIQEERDRFARENSLEAKIESSEVYLRTKQKQFEIMIRKRTQLAIEKKMRKASKTEKGWRRRMDVSIVLETQGTWEQRLDQRAGTCFFHKICDDPEIEDLADTCQWEVPTTWNGDPMVTTKDSQIFAGSDVKGSSNITEGLTHGENAFAQPDEVWMPHENEFVESHFSDGNTPGIRSSAVKRPGQEKGGLRLGTSNSMSLTSRASPSKDKSQRPQSTASRGGAAEDLLLNDDIVYALARRLGLPTDSIVPASQLPSVFTAAGGTSGGGSYDPFSSFQSSQTMHQGYEDEPTYAPRKSSDNLTNDAEDPPYDSDDELWSDDERLVGDMEDDDVGAFLPQDHRDVKRFKKEQAHLLGNAGVDDESAKSRDVTGPKGGEKVPFLNIAERMGVSQHQEGNTTVMAWRKLPRPEIPAKFFQKCTMTRTLGPDSDSISNQANTPVFLVPLSPVDACKYEPMTFSVDVESIFVPDARKDMDRVLANIERNIKREEQLSKNIPTDELLLFGGKNEGGMTSVDNFVAEQYRQDKDLGRDPKQEAVEKSLLAAKTSNISEMEDALEEDISIDTSDQFGNTLLILAAQQGSRRMCKYLLRRGANINIQSLAGHTALHYCYAYSHFELADYLKSRGADDSILNGEGLTCYEGLSTGGIAAIV